MQTTDKINFSNKHSLVLGRTESGKTYATIKSLKKHKEGVLFFNTYHSKDTSGYTIANKHTDSELLINALIKGEKVNYVPDKDPDYMEQELKILINRLFKLQSKQNVIFAIDEVHQMENKEVKKLIKKCWTAGRHYFNVVGLSQRGALVDNTLITQSKQYVFFATNLEQGYWENNYGIPLSDINNRIAGEDRLFCTYDLKETKGAYKIG